MEVNRNMGGSCGPRVGEYDEKVQAGDLLQQWKKLELQIHNLEFQQKQKVFDAIEQNRQCFRQQETVIEGHRDVVTMIKMPTWKIYYWDQKFWIISDDMFPALPLVRLLSTEEYNVFYNEQFVAAIQKAISQP